MEGLIFDVELDDGVIQAIRIILNAFSEDKKKLSSIQEERDSLLAQVKLLKIELQECKQREFGQRSSDNSVTENQRKQIKTEGDQFDDSILMKSIDDLSNDEFNAAFHISMNEDEIVEPTPYQPCKLDSNILKHITPIKSYTCLKGQNKENDVNMTDGENSSNKTAIERSPTMLSKHLKAVNRKPFRNNDPNDVSSDDQTRDSSTSIESAPWHTKKKCVTLTQLFENQSSSKRSQISPQKSALNARKKLNLSLASNMPRLRQSTITFQKCNEETFCELGSTEINRSQVETSASSIVSVPKQTKTPKNPMTSHGTEMLQHSFVAREKNKSYDNNSSVVLVRSPNEPIIIDESQSTQELYQHVLNIKKELDPETSIKMPKNALKTPPIDCEDCKEYHRMLGRDTVKNPPRKYGVCSKHHRNIRATNTPPGFWNPKISDSESDGEHTPYDHRFAKDRS